MLSKSVGLLGGGTQHRRGRCQSWWLKPWHGHGDRPCGCIGTMSLKTCKHGLGPIVTAEAHRALLERLPLQARRVLPVRIRSHRADAMEASDPQPGTVGSGVSSGQLFSWMAGALPFDTLINFWGSHLRRKHVAAAAASDGRKNVLVVAWPMSEPHVPRAEFARERLRFSER